MNETNLVNPETGTGTTPAVAAVAPASSKPVDPFAALNAGLVSRYYKPDLQAVRIVLGAVKSHYLKIGDPAWLFIIGPPGTGKTTITIAAATSLPRIIPLGDFSENTFLSGFYGHQEAGLLEKTGPTSHDGSRHVTKGDGILMAKDFTTVLSMRREKRGAILSQLREIHDGEFKRNFGTGEEKVWRGRVTIIAAVTPVIDRHYTIFNVLGERFLQIRWHRPDSEEAGEWAIRQQGQEEAIHANVRKAVDQLFANSAKKAPILSKKQRIRIACVAELVALGRTHVDRGSYGAREIEYVPEPEANTRISKGLAALAKGIAALNRHRKVGEADLQDVFRVAFDCLPEVRRKILLAAIAGQDLQSVALPRTVRDRAAEELEALEILTNDAGLPGGLPTYKLTDRAQRLISAAAVKL